jgi:hypothetical protein
MDRYNAHSVGIMEGCRLHLQADMAVEALQAELAAAAIFTQCPAIELHQCIAGEILVLPDPQQPPPWLAARSTLLATCVLPLASSALHARHESPVCPDRCCIQSFNLHVRFEAAI